MRISKAPWEIRKFPEDFGKVISNIAPEDLLLTYKKGGWNILQLIHHCADSHMNAFIRMKEALTGNNPSIMPYSQDDWVLQHDVLDSSVDLSLMIIKGIHGRWSLLLDNLGANDLIKTYYHPEHNKETHLAEHIFTYAWHCQHHLRHVEIALQKLD